MASSKLTGTGRPFDGVISPVSPHSASPRGGFGRTVGYTAMWNICDQPCVVFPVTIVDAAADPKQPNFVGRNEIEQAICDRYDPIEVKDCPVSLQVVAKRLEEEKAFAMTRVIAEALKATK